MGRLVLGHCLSVIPSIPNKAVDLVVTDPPYLVNYQDRSGRSIANDRDSDWLQPAFEQIHRVMKDNSMCVSFYGWSKVDLFFEAWRKAGFRVVGHVVCHKTYASKASYVKYVHESAYLLAKGRPQLPENPIPDVLQWKYSGNRLHPTQKPVSILKQFVEAFSRPNDIVLDPFAGSGSTCEAAHLAGRRYVGIEIDPTYHRLASQRMKDLQFRMAA